MKTIHRRYASMRGTLVVPGILILLAVAGSQRGQSSALTQNMKPATTTQTAAFAVAIRVDASRPKGELRAIWRFFGGDEPNYAYMKDGQKLLTELGQLRPHAIYFRTHNLLTSGDGTPALKWGSTNAYSEDAQGNPVYDWSILDRIFDTYLG